VEVHQNINVPKKLKRSANAVKIKATRLKLNLRLRDSWYTKSEVAEICGVDHKKVQQWIDSRALKATWHYGRKPCKEGMSSWHIEAEDLKEFIIYYCGELLGRNVDIQQIVWLLAGKPKICTHHKWLINGENIGTCANPECGEVRQFPWNKVEKVKVIKESKCNSRIRRAANHYEGGDNHGPSM